MPLAHHNPEPPRRVAAAFGRLRKAAGPRPGLYRALPLVLVVAIVVLTGALMENRIRDGHRRLALDGIVAVADADAAAYETFLRTRADDLSAAVHGPLGAEISQVVRGVRPPEDAASILREYIEIHGDVGFELLDRDDAVIATDDMAIPGATTRYELAEPRHERAGLGLVLGGLDAADDGMLTSSGQPFSLGLAVRLELPTGTLGTLILQLDAQGQFNAVAESSRAGRTGETYVVSNDGRMLTSSRFEPQIYAWDALPVGVPIPGNLRLSDPGRLLADDAPAEPSELDGPLTQAASAISAGESGQTATPYRDYLGRPVLGAWRYMPGLDFGIVSEVIDTEILASANSQILLLRLGLLTVIVFGAGLTVVSERASRLEQARHRDRTAAAQLEEAVEERTTQLRKALRLRRELLQSVSHELRTPLTVIMGLSETIERHVDRLSSDDLMTMATTASKHAGRLMSLIDDLTMADRLDTRTARVERRPVELRSHILTSIEQEQITSHNVQTDFPAFSVHAMVDPPKLERMLVALLTNAVQYTPPGTTINVALRLRDELLEIRVDDEGSGIDPAVSDEMLGAFQHGPDAINRSSPGLGLGLTLVSGFARLHGGAVQIERSPSGGARVRVVLPWIRVPTDVEDEATSATPAVAPVAAARQ